MFTNFQRTLMAIMTQALPLMLHARLRARGSKLEADDATS